MKTTKGRKEKGIGFRHSLLHQGLTVLVMPPPPFFAFRVKEITLRHYTWWAPQLPPHSQTYKSKPMNKAVPFHDALMHLFLTHPSHLFFFICHMSYAYYYLSILFPKKFKGIKKTRVINDPYNGERERCQVWRIAETGLWKIQKVVVVAEEPFFSLHLMISTVR